MTSIEQLDLRVGHLEDQVQEARTDIRAIRDLVQSLEARDKAREPYEVEMRTALRALPERVSALESTARAVQEQGRANGEALQSLADGRGWDRWIGGDGYLRSRSFVVVIGAILLGSGAATISEVASWLSSSSTLVPLAVQPEPAPAP